MIRTLDEAKGSLAKANSRFVLQGKVSLESSRCVAEKLTHSLLVF
ncbi:hypothetical protein COO91_06965 [Nostoc flagelliforme CCNUN1]|uniref:Uncharacterized protein n=1 Tax=Nostoc flagelliforme CCNUN1 TaxID=2038116 RepID=A0A2K8SZT3_9NOSO|nr:hypothetical protein COO91_06965 [Nostoc flagelliforme CCNUN1]